jgi:hypothetical protein
LVGEDDELDEELDDELVDDELEDDSDDKDEVSVRPAARVDGDRPDWGPDDNGKLVWVPGAI